MRTFDSRDAESGRRRRRRLERYTVYISTCLIMFFLYLISTLCSSWIRCRMGFYIFFTFFFLPWFHFVADVYGHHGQHPTLPCMAMQPPLPPTLVHPAHVYRHLNRSPVPPYRPSCDSTTDSLLYGDTTSTYPTKNHHPHASGSIGRPRKQQRNGNNTRYYFFFVNRNPIHYVILYFLLML